MSTTATKLTTRETVDSFFARFGAGDLPALLDLFAEQVDFRVSGALTSPGPAAGPARKRLPSSSVFSAST